jgi:thiol-disulfide isomerase/thioredoxin
MSQLARYRLTVIVVFVATSMMGCAPPNSTPRKSRPLPPITLSPVDRQAFDRVLFENTGRVILVNYWATWNEPSMRQLSHMKVLQEVYGSNGFQVITVSLDNAPNEQSVVQFLQAQRALGVVHLISVRGADSESFQEFEITDESIPFYVLYDRMGKLTKTYSGPIDGIEQEIETLIEQKDFDQVVPGS